MTGRVSIKYLRLECLESLTNLRMYGSKSRIRRNAYIRENGSMWGLVKIYVMKNPIPLKVVSSIQAHSKSLKIYVKIGLLERGKPHGEKVWRRRKISSLTCGESSGTTDEASVMEVEEQPRVKLKNSNINK